MEPHADRRRPNGSRPLGQQGGDDPRQHVAAAALGQAGISGGVHQHVPRRGGGEGPVALQHQDTAMRRSKGPGGPQPVAAGEVAADAGELGSNGILPDVESLRIPVQYLANLLTAGDTQPVLLALKRMLAMRHYKRAETVDGVVDTRALEEVGLSEAQAQEMYRYLAIANYEDRFVVPSSHREQAREAFPEKNGCGFSFGDGCHGSDSQFNLFNSRRIDAIDVTSKTEPHA